MAAAARGGARHGSDNALPPAGPAHLASCSAAGVSRALTCPSRIAQADVGEQLAGLGDLGDVARLDAAAGDDGVPGLVDRVPAGVRWTASTSAQRSTGEPCLVIRPRITVVSDS